MFLDNKYKFEYDINNNRLSLCVFLFRVLRITCLFFFF